MKALPDGGAFVLQRAEDMPVLRVPGSPITAKALTDRSFSGIL
jgi:hypothetical protein